MLHHIIYLSRATQPLSDDGLINLLAQTRHDNAAQDVTGFLAYGSDQFLQVIEGDETTIRALYERIRQDPRHRDVSTFADKHIPNRAFADWSMAFQPLNPAQLQTVMGYLPAADLALDQEKLSTVDGQLLQTLRGFVLG